MKKGITDTDLAEGAKSSQEHEIKKEEAASGSKQEGQNGQVKNLTATPKKSQRNWSGWDKRPALMALEVSGVVVALGAGLGAFLIVLGVMAYEMLGIELFDSIQAKMMKKLVNLAVGIATVVFGVLATFGFFDFKPAGLEEAKILVLVQKIKGRLQEQLEASLKSDGSVPNYVVVDHLREELQTPEEERIRKLDLWTKAVDHIKLKENRIGEEIRQSGGDELKAWRWISDTADITTN